jgi:hypothetical protein
MVAHHGHRDRRRVLPHAMAMKVSFNERFRGGTEEAQQPQGSTRRSGPRLAKAASESWEAVSVIGRKQSRKVKRD